MMKYAKTRSEEEKKEVYNKWHDLINMSQKALDDWAENDNRLLASINREEAKESGDIQSGYDSFHRIKRRKEKPFKDWTNDDFDNAAQENGFNSRMLGGKPGDPVGESGMSKWEISLRNWGHDPSLKSSPQHAKWKAWKIKHTPSKKSSATIELPHIIIENFKTDVWKILRTTRNAQALQELYMEFTSRLRDSVLQNIVGTEARIEYLGLNRAVGKYRQLISQILELPDAVSLPNIARLNTAIDKMKLASLDIERHSVKIDYQKFKYKGFNVESFDLSDNEVRSFLDGIDFIEAIFKERDMTPIMRDSITSIQLLRQEQGSSTAGEWISTTRTLKMFTNSLGVKGRVLANFVHEVLLHEIGHWVHLNYITREAREFWDSGWEYINREKEDFFEKNLKKFTITPEDRSRYFTMFQEAKGDPKIVKSNASPLDILKIHGLFTQLSGRKPLMTPSNFRLTAEGKVVMEFFKDPLHYFYEVRGHSREDWNEQDALERATENINRIFMLSGLWEDVGLQLESDKTKEFALADRELHLRTIEEMKQALGIPTDYGKTNEKEDFAETFVQFVLDPSKLSQTARWRMGRTLGLSDSTGARVMKLSKRKSSMNKSACVISCLDLDDKRYLLKIRDRNYNPEIKIYHDLYDGVEVLYYIDNVTGWLEGVNSYGISIVNSALNVREDEEEGSSRNQKKEPMISQDGFYLLNALKCKTIEEALKCIAGNSFHVPVHGHTIISDGTRAKIIEQTSIHQPVVKTLQRHKLHVRTNHGINHPDAGYQSGDDRQSSLRRRELATEILSNVTDIKDAAPALYGYRWDKMDDPFIPVRKVPNGLYSTSQIMFDPQQKKMVVYLIPNDVDFLGYEKRFESDEEPICKLEVIQYSEFDEKGKFEQAPFNWNPARIASLKASALRVASLAKK